jgi:heat shock protein HslJ
MTDDQMDARLRRAGEMWRAAEPSAPMANGPAEDHPIAAVERPRRAHRIGLLASAAVVVAALIAGGAFVVGGFGGNGSDKTTGAAALKGTVWRLVGYDHQQQQTNSLSTFYISDEGRLVADDSCTVVVASARTDGGRLQLGTVESRYVGCADAVGSLTFDRGLATLTSHPAWSVDGKDLTISHGGDPTLHLRAAPELVAPSADRPVMPGAKWRLVQILADDGDRKVYGSPTLEIKNGRLTASDGCNSLGGEVTVDGRRLTTKELASTAIGCTSQVGLSAAVIDGVLGGGPTWYIGANQLNLVKKGVGSLVYDWVPDDDIAVAAASMTGRKWVLASVAGVPAAAPATLAVDAHGHATGTDGCEDLEAEATFGAGTVTLTGIPDRPPPGCTGTGADQASTIDSFLSQKPALWSVRDGRLIIGGGGAQAFSLVYETATPPSEPDPASQVAGTTWTLSTIETNGPDDNSGVATSQSGVTLAFDAKGGYRLASHCGAQVGKAHVTRRTIEFSDARTDGGNYDACLQESFQGAAKQLAGTVDWKIDNRQLRLTKGSTTLLFDPA